MNSADALAKETIAAVYGDVEKRQRVLKIEFLTDRERERLERRLADALRSTRPEESSPIRWPPKWRMLIVRRRLRQVPVAKKPARSRRRLASRRRV